MRVSLSRVRTRLSIAQSPQSDFTSPVVRIGYSSLVTPFSIIDVNMVTGAHAYALGVPDSRAKSRGVMGKFSRCALRTLGVSRGSALHWSAVQTVDSARRIDDRNTRHVHPVKTAAGNAAVKKVMVIEGGYDSELYQADQVQLPAPAEQTVFTSVPAVTQLLPLSALVWFLFPHGWTRA